MVAPPEPVNEIVPEPIPLDIVYEDEHFLALNKQADLIVHPARGRWHGHARQRPGPLRPEVEHASTATGGRASCTGSTATRPASCSSPRATRRTGGSRGSSRTARSRRPTWPSATACRELLADVIDMPIGKDRYVREKQAVRKVENGGKPAVTKYEVQEIFQTPPRRRRSNRAASPPTATSPRRRSGFRWSSCRPRPAARTSCASTWRTWATRWSATRCTAGGSSSTGELPVRAAGPARV